MKTGTTTPNTKDKLTNISEITNQEAATALEQLETIVKSLSKIKTLANNIRWRISSANDSATLRVSDYVCPQSNANGFRIPLIDETFYSAYEAAKLLNTSYQNIQHLAAAGELYSMGIGGKHYFPDGALRRYKQLSGNEK